MWQQLAPPQLADYHSQYTVRDIKHCAAAKPQWSFQAYSQDNVKAFGRELFAVLVNSKYCYCKIRLISVPHKANMWHDCVFKKFDISQWLYSPSSYTAASHQVRARNALRRAYSTMSRLLSPQRSTKAALMAQDDSDKLSVPFSITGLVNAILWSCRLITCCHRSTIRKLSK